MATRLLQFLQCVVFKVLPFGALGNLSLLDVGIGILITGSYYLYFCTSRQHAPALLFCMDFTHLHTCVHLHKHTREERFCTSRARPPSPTHDPFHSFVSRSRNLMLCTCHHRLLLSLFFLPPPLATGIRSTLDCASGCAVISYPFCVHHPQPRFGPERGAINQVQHQRPDVPTHACRWRPDPGCVRRGPTNDVCVAAAHSRARCHCRPGAAGPG